MGEFWDRGDLNYEGVKEVVFQQCEGNVIKKAVLSSTAFSVKQISLFFIPPYTS